MLFMAKSNHRRDDIVESVASSTTPEYMDATPGTAGKDDTASRGSQALLSLTVFLAIIAVLALPVLYWIS